MIFVVKSLKSHTKMFWILFYWQERAPVDYFKERSEKIKFIFRQMSLIS